MAIDFPCDRAKAREAVLAAARDLINATRASCPGWSPPPFNPELYARILGIPVIMTRELTDWDALFVPLVDGKRILCNARVPSKSRRAFSIAHELAHSFFSDNADRYYARSRNRDEYYRTDDARFLERLCDMGAAELLMPDPWFGDAMACRDFTARTVPELADVFGVSLEAAALRILERQSEATAVGFFHFSPLPSVARAAGEGQWPGPQSVTYRVRRVFKSRDFPFLFPVGKSVPENSVIYEASMQLDQLRGVETFTLSDREARLDVSAYPLHRGAVVEDPPTVCAVFRLAVT